MNANEAAPQPYHEPNKGPKELNIFSIDKVESEDDLFDFRAIPLPSDVEEEANPKGLPATAPAENSSSTPNTALPQVQVASVAKGKSQGQKAS